MPLKIFINGRFLSQSLTGVQRYAAEMVKAMPEKVLDSMVQRTPIGRMGEPRDIAEAYFWLASDAASFVHGTVLSVDGGIVIGT